MTYEKIYVPIHPISQNNSETSDIKSDKTTENSGYKDHRPQILISDNIHREQADVQNTSYIKSRLLPSVVTVFVVIALCFCSFILGCCVTGSSLSSAIIGISTVASGRIPFEENNPASDSEELPVYEKYMSEGAGEIEYIAADPYLEEDAGDFNDLQGELIVKEVLAESAQGAKAGADGEVLYPVIAKNLSTESVHYLNNQTKYSPDTYALIKNKPEALENIHPDEPTVLIVHTHGLESYNMCNTDGYYSNILATRSEKESENVVRMGNKITEILENFGINTIHCKTLCDKDSFVYAYSTSSEIVSEYLKKYPSIKIVIDLHRDSIESADRTKTKPVFSFAGRDTAQLMFVVGTDEAGATHPNWQENLSFALHLQSEISKDYPELFRKINLRSASFNQQLSPGYLLLECGSCASTVEEAENAANLFATGLARAIKH